MAMSFIFWSMALLQLGLLALNEDAIACVRVGVDRDRRKDTRARVHGWRLGFFPSRAARCDSVGEGRPEQGT